MKRCNNVTISRSNIEEVENKARDLLACLNDINFVLTRKEQQGLFSIIEALHWEPEINENFWSTEPADKSSAPIHSPLLTQLLEQIKTR